MIYEQEVLKEDCSFLKMLEINSKMNLRYGWNKDREAPLALYSFHVARRLLEKESTEELAI